MAAWDDRPDYTWRLELDDGSVVEQYDELGEEVLFGSVDLTRVREASWVPTSRLIGEATFTVLVEPGQTPILFRRHRVKGDSDTVVMYGLGVREGEREAVMLIDPRGGVLLAW
jgi:hypothetical protein